MTGLISFKDILEEFKKTLDSLYKVNYGDFVMPQDHNSLVKSIKKAGEAVRWFFGCIDAYNIASMLEFTNIGNIILPEHYNQKVDFLKEVVNECIPSPIRGLNNYDVFKDIVESLRYVNYGDYVLSDDHNNIVQALQNLYEFLEYILENALFSGVWISGAYNIQNINVQPYDFNNIIIKGANSARNLWSLVKISKDGYVVWILGYFSSGIGSLRVYMQYIFFVSGDYIYIYDSDGNLVRKFILPYIPSSYIARTVVFNISYDGYIYLNLSYRYSSISATGMLYKMDFDGNILWYAVFGNRLCTEPHITSDGYIYIAEVYEYDTNYHFRKSWVNCVSAYDGTKIWTVVACPDGADLCFYYMDTWFIPSNCWCSCYFAPLVYEDYIYFIGTTYVNDVYSPNDLRKYDRYTGTRIWKIYLTGDSTWGWDRYGVVLINQNGDVVILNDIDGFHYYRGNDGTEVWSYNPDIWWARWFYNICYDLIDSVCAMEDYGVWCLNINGQLKYKIYSEELCDEFRKINGVYLVLITYDSNLDVSVLNFIDTTNVPFGESVSYKNYIIWSLLFTFDTNIAYAYTPIPV